MTVTLPTLTAAGFVPHRLHATERTWTETNCYVDVWIEVLHALGLDPVAAAAFTLSCDFEGDQWTFFKYPPEDLRTLFGVEVAEMNVWRPVIDHVAEQLAMGRLCTVEGDSWFLPDTRGVAYGIDHVKSTLVPVRLDRSARRLGYFHNAGYYELEGDDFDGLFRLGAHADPSALPPYVESIRLDRVRRGDPDLVDRVVFLTRDHLARRPADNPILRMAERMIADLPWLAEQDLEGFHLYSFGLCRQCGASTELAATFVDWLNTHDGPGTEEAATAFREVAEGAKSLQFALARVVRGRSVDLEGVFAGMAEQWQGAMDVLSARYGG
ncbi:MAG: DUF1839 family protein [Acidimicrobiales bacterium]|jgi:hypothetical protein